MGNEGLVGRPSASLLDSEAADSIWDCKVDSIKNGLFWWAIFWG